MPPKIDKDKCNGCGICLFQCGVQCFTFDTRQYKTYAKQARKCIECLICQHTCPQGAITIKSSFAPLNWSETTNRLV